MDGNIQENKDVSAAAAIVKSWNLFLHCINSMNIISVEKISKKLPVPMKLQGQKASWQPQTKSDCDNPKNWKLIKELPN